MKCFRLRPPTETAVTTETTYESHTKGTTTKRHFHVRMQAKKHCCENLLELKKIAGKSLRDNEIE